MGALNAMSQPGEAEADRRREPLPPSSVRRGLRAAWAAVADVLYPVLVILRGSIRAGRAGYAWWTSTPRDTRGAAVAATALGSVALAAMPYGPALLAAGLAAVATWFGRGQAGGLAAGAPSTVQDQSLKVVYSALIPHMGGMRGNSRPTGDEYRSTFSRWRFDDHDHLIALDVVLAAGLGGDRARDLVEQALVAAASHGGEYRFEWTDDGRRLAMRVLPALPRAGAVSLVADGVVLGLTDGATSDADDLATSATSATPLVWRPEPGDRLLAVARPGGGGSHLLRSLAAQALAQGSDVTLLDVRGTGGYTCLDALGPRCRVARSEEERRAAMSACLVAERRSLDRPGWLLVDGLPDQAALGPLLRDTRAAGLTLVLAARPGEAPAGASSAFDARISLGPMARPAATELFGAPPAPVGGERLPPGRGYARLDAGAIVRLQVPYAPDPLAATTPPQARAWLARLLPAAAISR